MKHEHNAFENQIFHHFRERAKAINKAIELLVEHNYTVIDMESQIITKETIKQQIKPTITPTRYSKRNTE